MRWRSLTIIVLLISSCGIPLDNEPNTLERPPDVPSHIEIPGNQELEAVTLYLVRDDRISSITRDLATPPDAELVVDSLLDGTTPPEERANLRTSIPPGTESLKIDVTDGVATVDLSTRFTRVGGDEEILAVAQIVLSLCELEDVDSVLFLISGIPTAVPVSDGALTDRPVGAKDYRPLISA